MSDSRTLYLLSEKPIFEAKYILTRNSSFGARSPIISEVHLVTILAPIEVSAGVDPSRHHKLVRGINHCCSLRIVVMRTVRTNMTEHT